MSKDDYQHYGFQTPDGAVCWPAALMLAGAAVVTLALVTGALVVAAWFTRNDPTTQELPFYQAPAKTDNTIVWGVLK